MRPVFLFSALLSLVFSTAAVAVEPVKDFTFRGMYKCTLAGIPFAKIGLHAEQDNHAYAMTSDIVSVGVVNLFSKHSSHTTVDGSGARYGYTRIDYESNYKTKNKKRYVQLRYKDGKFLEETLVPPENPAKREPVPVELKNEAYDPLSGLLAVRMALIDALKRDANQFRMNIYDGRRLTEVNFIVAGKTVVKVNGTKTPVVEIAARRRLVAGFTPSEQADYDPKEPTLHIYFSDNETFFPVRLEVRFLFGQLAADLYKICTTSESCLLGNKE